MNKTILLTRDDADEVNSCLLHTEWCDSIAETIQSQLNSNSIQEAWEELRKNRILHNSVPDGFDYRDPVSLYTEHDVLTFLKTIGVEVE